MSKDVIFIDSRAGGASLVSGQVGPDTEIIILDGIQNGLEQMARALIGRSGLDSVQLISHGAAGTLLLGNMLITRDDLAGYQSHLRLIGASLADGGDFLLYGSDVADGEAGQRFIEALALATGADVAASTDLSGPAGLGGNWTLEAAVGTVETASLSVATDDALGLYTGTSGNDTLQGGYGSDTILGGDGDDSISGTYYSSSGRGGDHLDGGNGNDSIWGSLENDLLIGGAGDDTLESGTGRDTVQGGDGDDLINMYSANADQLIDGGAGNDTIYADGNDTVTGGDGNDLILNTAWTDRSVLLQVDGGAGDDTIQMLFFPKPDQQMLATGGTGRDTFVPGMYNVNGQNVVTDFSAGPGGDLIDVSQLLINSTTFGMTTAINPFNASYRYLRLIQDGSDTLLQYDVDGIASGTDEYKTVLVLRNVNASSLTKENFTDLISPDGGKSGGQVVITPNGLGVLQGGFYNDTITGGTGTNTLAGGYGNDRLQGGNQPDGETGDEMTGGAGDDTLIGGTGNDTLRGDSGSDYVDGGSGDDHLISGGIDSDSNKGIDTLIGGDGNDTLSFSAIFYNGAPVIINGGAGDDVIDAWSGAGLGVISGILTGGSGSDTFGTRSSFLWSVDNILQVTDFKVGAGGDRVDAEGLLGYDILNFKTNPWLIGSGFVRLLQSGADTLVQHDMDGIGGVKTFVTVLALQNVNASQFTQANWLAHLLQGGTGDNTLYGGFGADTLSGAGGNDVLDGGVGDNLLLGGSGDDMLLGGAGADRLDAGVGADVADGGAGADTLTVLGNFADYVLTRPSQADTLLVNQATGEHVLLRNIETVIFADGVKAIAEVVAGLGSAGADLLIGTGGADTLDGLAGSDTMSGGAGDDVYVVDASGDVVNEGADAGTDRVDTALTTYTLGANVENLRHTGGAAFAGTGNELANLIEGGGGNDVLLGASGADTLLGNAGKDKLDGGAGDDVLSGGASDDTLMGGAGDDALNVGTGTGFDLADGGAGTDTLTVSGNFSSYARTRVNATDLVLDNAFTAESVTLRNIEHVVFADGVKTMAQILANLVTAFDDVVAGDEGANAVDGGKGNDTMTGGDGDDVYAVDAVGDVIVENADGGTDSVNVALATAGTYVLSANVENATVTGGAAIAVGLTGNESANILTGNAAANVLTGNAGNDKLDGGAGADKLTGGSGNDTYVVDVAGDVVTELAGEGTDSVQASLSTYTLTANVENLAYTGKVAFTGTGNALDNAIGGGNAGNKLDGGAGNDQLTGGTGNDNLIGGLGDDTFVGTTGKDTIDGGAGADWLQGLGKFGDYVVARPTLTDTVLTDVAGNVTTVRGVENFAFADGDRTLVQVQENIASVGNDSLLGTDANDVLNGGLGVDTLSGGLGDDTYVILNAADVVLENAGEGVDLVQVALTAAGGHTLAANVENATVTAAASVAVNLTGNDLDNVLTGNAAANTLTGGAGNDTLIGGAGSDALKGGTGNDIYVVADSGDTVTELAGEGTDTVQTSLATYTLTANVENLAYAGKAAFTGTGNALDNVIGGGNAGNRLDGGAGNDQLTGGTGNDNLIGGLGDDTFVGTTGKDTIDGGAGTDWLQGLGKFGDYVVTRPTLTDTVLTDAAGNVTTVRGVENFAFADGGRTLVQVQDNIASAGNDNLRGTDGNDVLNGGLGVDTLSGGLGDDVYVILNAADVVLENSGEGVDLVQVALTAAGSHTLAANVENATVTAAASIAVNLAGNDLDNVLTGNAAANTLTGGAGNDTLDGAGGADKLTGGSGDDTYVVDVAGNIVTELAGEGTDTVRASLATYTLTANVENLAYTGKAAFTGTGNALDNVITGGNAGNRLDGGAGNDQLTGGNGADNLIGGLGDDTFIGTAGKDTVDGGAGDDLLRIGGKFANYAITRPIADDVVLTDKAGNVLTVRNVEQFEFSDGLQLLDSVLYNVPSRGNDRLYGTAGADTLDGGTGADTMNGNDGDDTYLIDNVGDVIEEGQNFGNDTALVALATAGTYTLGGDVEIAKVTSAATVAVNLTGNDVDNLLTGNAAANTLTGGGGNDTLDGAAGSDKLVGGSGDDTYLVDVAGDVVTELADEGTDTVRTSLATHTLVVNVENLAYTGTAAFTGAGNALDNVITGGNAGNKLNGGAGNDQLTGGNGADNLIGGLGDDTFVGATGKDTIDGGADTDVLTGLGARADYVLTRPNADDIVLTDKAGNVLTVRNVERFEFSDGPQGLETLVYNMPSIGKDQLYGTAGADTMDGGAGADTMDGGDGDDTYLIDNVGDVINEGQYFGNDVALVALATAGTYTLGGDVETAKVTSAASVAVNLTGNDIDNLLTGNAAANTLTGGGGNDTLDGAAGSDKLLGGDGDDVYLVNDAADTITEAADAGRDVVRTSLAAYTLAANVELLNYTGTAAFAGTGNALDNEITGGNFGNKLDGGVGNDTLTGGTGNDNLAGGTGDDEFFGGGGNDTIDGGLGADRFWMQSVARDQVTVTRISATDTVLTDSAGKTVTLRNVESVEFSDWSATIDELQYNLPSPGGDHLYGGGEADTLNGGLGADTLDGGAGDDTYVIADKAAVVLESEDGGIDTVQVALAAAGTYTLADNVEHAKVTAAATVAVNLAGNALANELRGNAAANTLSGGAGNDTLDGGAGADQLAGGTGDDIYIVADSGDAVTELADAGIDTVITNVSAYTLGANVELLFYAGNGMFTGTGNALHNLMVAGDGGSRLDGGGGDDFLVGGAGNDSLAGGIGDDLFDASAGVDTTDGGAGNDTLSGLDDYGYYNIVRLNATDTLLTHYSGAKVTVRNVESFDFGGTAMTLAQTLSNSVGPGTDTVFGSDGADVLDGGAGDDVLIGGIGDDRYVLSSPGDIAFEEEAWYGHDTVELAFSTAGTYTMDLYLEDAFITGTAAVGIIGNGENNYLGGNAAANTLRGEAGNDTLVGGAGSDTMAGGIGDDAYVVADSGDQVRENAGDGYDVVYSRLAAYTLTANVEDLVYDGAGVFTGTGNAGANRLYAGYSSSATLDGGAGQDTFGGLNAFSSYHIFRANSTDTVLTDSDGHVYTVRNVENFSFSDAGLMTLAQVQQNTASTGADQLSGTDGNDTLDGGAGADTMAGVYGNDVYVVDNVNDKVVETADGGYDSVLVALSAAGTYVMAANVEHAVVTSAVGAGAVNVTGNELGNEITGNAAANKLIGGDGADLLDGGAGSDALTGGAGADTFVLNSRAGSDTITDFVSGTDYLAPNLAALGVGNGDLLLDGATTRDAPGGFARESELVLFSARMSSASTANAAVVIGSANSAYAAGETALFAVSTATATSLYLFKSSGADAIVSAAELTQLAVLTGTPSTVLADYMF